MIPPGNIATLRFDLPTGAVNSSQTLHIAQLESFTSQALAVASITTLDGFIADANNPTADADSDGMSDKFEAANGLHPLDLADAAQDADEDGLTNLAEFNLGTNINNADTDGDGMSDKFESLYAGLNPLLNDATADLDGDGLSNVLEAQLGLNPIVSDGAPVASGTALSGQLTVNTVLVANGVYTVPANLEIVSGKKLTIAPGIKMTFSSGAKLTVSGTLVVIGTATSRAQFTGSTGSRGSWGGIAIGATSTNSVINYADLQWAVTSVDVNGARVEVRHSLISNYSGNGINFLNGAGGAVANNVIDNHSTTGYAIVMSDASVAVKGYSLTISGNTLQNNLAGINIGRNSYPVISGSNLITANGYGLLIGGTYNLATDPKPVINGNSIYANTIRNMAVSSYQNATNVTLDMTNNWWGTTDIPTIANSILDGANIGGGGVSPRVKFWPFLDAAGGSSTYGTALSAGILADTTLSGSRVYDVLENAVVAPGAKLTIESGAKLRFYGYATILQVDGTLLVNGSVTQPVTFTTGYTTTAKGMWKGMILNNVSVSTALNYVVVEQAQDAVSFIGGGGSLTNSIVRNNSNYGIYIKDASPMLSANSIQGNSSGIRIERKSSPTINNGNIVTANAYGVYVLGVGQTANDPRPLFNGNSIYGNTQSNFYTSSFQNAASVVLDATNNWWGTTDIAAIESTIYDYADTPGSPVVRILTFLDAANGNPTVGNGLAGNIATNTTLLSGATYEVLENSIVPAGSTMTVQAGAILRFYGKTTTLRVDGTLLVQGTSASPVKFTSNLAFPGKGSWGGLVITASGGGSVIQFADIQWATTGIDVSGAQVQIRNCTIMNYSNSGISMTAGAGGIIADNVIDNVNGQSTGGKGVFLNTASPAITGNTIKNNIQGIDIGSQSNPIINNGNVITSNSIGINMYGVGQAAKDPKAVINGNSIYANSAYNYASGAFFNPSAIHIDVTNNWWGTTDVPTILSKINDNMDNATYSPVADFVPFLDAQNGNSTRGNALTGVVGASTTLVGNATYEVIYGLSVPASVSLTINPGAQLRFWGPSPSLQVDGTLLAQGVSGNLVRFTTSKTVPTKGSWKGIVLSSSSTGNVVDYAAVEWATDGISFVGASGSVTNSLIQNNSVAGIYVKDAAPLLNTNTIQNNQYGVRLDQKANPTITLGNVITANTHGIYAYGVRNAALDPKPVVSGNSVYNNTSYNYYTYNYIGGNNLTLDATSNWWGTTDVAVILAKIYDNRNAGDYSPKLNFLPFLDAQNGNATNGTVVANAVSSSTVLATGLTHEVLSSVTVAAGATLTIEPGATLRFYTSTSALQVNGALLVQGSATNPVRFTSSGSTAKGSWQGLVLNAGSNGSLIENAVVEYAKDGISFLSGAGGTVRNTTVKNSSNAGIYIKDASPLITGSTLQGSIYGVYIERKSNPAIQDGNLITSNSYGIYAKGVNQLGNDPMPVVTNNSIYSNTTYNLYANSYYNANTVTLDATNNWWGTTDVPTIVSKMYDNIDMSTSAPIAQFVPFQNADRGTPITGTVLNVAGPGLPTIAANTTYDVLSKLNVPVGESLVIPAGAKLRFYGVETELRVDGNVQVQGVAGNPVTFTSGLTTPAKGVWAGIVITPNSTGSSIEGAVVEWASNGVFFNASAGTVRASTIRNNLNGIYIYKNATPLITGANIITANNTGINIYGSQLAGLDPNPVVTGNSIYSNSPYNLRAYWFYNPASVHLNATGNWWGTTTAATINTGVYDYTDSPSYSPIVDLAPVLSASP